MTEPLDLEAIEDSYVGYDPDYPVFRLIAAVRERDAEIARLRAPPGADVHALAAEVLGDWRGRLALALQQYGDERAAAAIESLREPTVAMRIAGDHFEGDTVGTWRAMFNAALAAKPGSKP